MSTSSKKSHKARMKIIDLMDKSAVDKKVEVGNSVKTIKSNNWMKPEIDSEDFAQNSEVTKLAMTIKAFQFTDNVSMHGLRYIFMRDMNQMRRLVWLLVVLGGMGYCAYIVYETFISYLMYPTVTKISTTFERRSKFPAVTFCNFNAFQRSKITPELEVAIAKVYGRLPGLQRFDLSKFDNLDMTELFYNSSFNYDTSVCTHKEEPCNETLISMGITDHGVCITFDPSKDVNSMYQTRAGQNGGLYLGMVYHRKDWTRGPHYTVEGFRIAIHEPGTTVQSLSENGISLLPGLITDITLSRSDIHLLPPPYGQCGSKTLSYFNSYSMANCQSECHTKHTVNICGCKFTYMPGPAKICNLREHDYCYRRLRNDSDLTNLFDATSCQCANECNYTKYQAHVTYTQPSDGFASILASQHRIDITSGVALRLFYKELQYTEEIEEPVYTVEKLLCDIGGAAGLFLGCSFVTFFEFMDFAFEFFLFWSKKGALLQMKKPHEVN